MVFIDPRLAAVVLATREGNLVMCAGRLSRRSFPSGCVDHGEPMDDAAIREVKEETGLDIELGKLAGLYSWSGSPVVLAVYTAQVVGGTLEPGHEAQDAAPFHPHELSPPPFTHDQRILRDWRRLRDTS